MAAVVTGRSEDVSVNVAISSCVSAAAVFQKVAFRLVKGDLSASKR